MSNIVKPGDPDYDTWVRLRNDAIAELQRAGVDEQVIAYVYPDADPEGGH